MSCEGVKIVRRGRSFCPTTFKSASDGDTEEGLLCGCPQTLELHPTGGQPGPIFAVLPQAGQDLSLQTNFPSLIGCLSGVVGQSVRPHCFRCGFIVVDVVYCTVL